MIITFLSKLFGFVRDLVLAYFYGASNISDAYIVSLTIPSVIFAFVAAGISTGYIPMYNRVQIASGDAGAKEYTNNLINVTFLLCSVIVLLVLLFTKQIVAVFASGFDDDTLNMAVQFTQISILSIYFTGMVSIYKSYLQIQGSFIITSLMGFVLNACILLSIYISSKYSLTFLAIGTVAGAAAQLIVLLPYVYRQGYRYKLFVNLHDKHIKEMAVIALPVILSTSITDLNKLVDRTIASQIAVGGISSINYANTLKTFVMSIFVTSILTVLYPLISKMAAEGNVKGLKKSFRTSLIAITIIIIPATVGLMFFSEPIVRVLFARGQFDEYAIDMTSGALFFYAIGLIGFSFREVISRVFYSLQDIKTPTWNASISIIINIILNIILSKYMGIGGLALATSISGILCTVLLLRSLKKKIGDIDLKQIFVSMSKVMVASIIMGITSIIIYNRLGIIYGLSEGFALLISIVVAVAVYIIMIYFMKLKEVDELKRTVMRKWKKRSNT